MSYLACFTKSEMINAFRLVQQVIQNQLPERGYLPKRVASFNFN
jgi:hypothetical protein